MSVQFGRVPLWLYRVDVSHRAIVVYGLMAARWANRHDHSLTVYRQTIADELRMSTKTVERAIRELRAAGAIRVEAQYKRDGWRTNNRYVLAFESPFESSTDIGGTDVSVGSDISVATDTDTSDAGLGQECRNNEPESLEPESVEPESNKPGARECDFDGEFDEVFWPRYSEHQNENEAGARREFRKARGKVSLATLTNALQAYIEMWNAEGTDPQYIVRAQRWLRDERWQDTMVEPPLTSPVLHPADQRAIELLDGFGFGSNGIKART